jgi:hypothetical protein
VVAVGKGGRAPPPKQAKTTGKSNTANAKGPKDKPALSPGAAADAATVAKVYKELTALRAENAALRKAQNDKGKNGGTSAGPPAARAQSAEPGAEDAEVTSKKKRMDVLRGQIEHLEKAGDGLEDILAARRAELERLRGEVRAAHPLDVQLRNLDSKLGAVRKQREKLECEAKTTAALILELKASLDKTAKAVAEKRAEETQLAVERVELVARQAAATTSGGDGNPGGGDDAIPEQLRGLGLDGMDPGLRAGLRAFFARKAAAGSASMPPAGAAAAPANGSPGSEAAVAAAAAEAAARAAEVLDGADADMQKEEEEAKKRRRLGETA